MYDARGRLTRAGAMQVISGGGSVVINGQLITDVRQIPNEATFAKGDSASEAAAKERLEKTIADARKQLNAMGVPAPATPVPQLSSAPGDELEQMTVVALKGLASERQIPGYGTMNKADLVAALRG